MRLGSHGGSQTILTLASRTPDTPSTAFSTWPGNSAADGQFGNAMKAYRDWKLDEDARRVRAALGSVGPTIIRARDAEDQLTAELERTGGWDDPGAPVGQPAINAFAERVAEAARPIDDVRGSAAYRRHAIEVLARRALGWALSDRRSRP